LRTKGLRGLVDAYPDYMLGPNKEILLANFNAAAENILRTPKGDTTNVVPLMVDTHAAMPQLPRTFLDEEADFRQPFQRGLYQGVSEGSVKASSGEKVFLNNLLNQRVTFKSLGRDLKNLIKGLAPQLASILLKPIEEGWVQLMITPNAMGQGAYGMSSVQTLMGLRSKDREYIHVQGGLTYKDVILSVVSSLSRYAFPDKLNQKINSINRSSKPEEMVQVWTMLLDKMNRFHEMWAWSGVFQFREEAKQRGFQIPLPDPERQEAMKEVLEKCGLFVLVEQYSYFADPEKLQIMQQAFYEAARDIVDRLLSQK